MDTNKELLISLLNSAIHNNNKNIRINGKIDWDIVYNDAKAHHIDALLYPVIKMLNTDQKPDDELMVKWKKDTLLTGITQIKNIRRLGEILGVFNEKGIKVIVLKGILLRELYPRAELRSMSDADILIQKKDLDYVAELLTGIGYYQAEVNAFHITFCHKTNITIEVHWSLIDKEVFKDAVSFESDIWNCTKSVSVNGVASLGLSNQDHLVYLFLHMAAHTLDSGFGLRQLSDVVLLIEDEGDKIDWLQFFHKVKIIRIECFVIAILEVCQRLFGLSLPYKKEEYLQTDNHYIELLIQDIISGGVYGNRNMVRINGNSLLHYTYHNETKTVPGKIKRYISFLLPNVERLSEKYMYAKKYKVLLPAAWLHRISRYIFRKDCSLGEKAIMVLGAGKIAKKRAKLISWLKLR